VDIAGYLHVDQAAAPARLYALALGEPERTLRAEVLRSLQVRRPDLRPLLAWFEQRRAFSATIVLDEDGPLGFILLPEGSRRTVMALEEARAIRVLADRISALLAVSSALARSRQRELDAQQRVAQLGQENERLEGIITTDAERNRMLPERYADAVRRTAYSAAARLALDQLERLGRQNAPVALIAPPGVGAAGWSSVVHLASPRSAGPLVMVDGTRSTDHDPQHWENVRASPLQLAEGGTLVILNLAALPSEVQQLLIGRLVHAPSSTESSSVPRPGLVATVSSPPPTLVEAGRLERSLARWLATSTVELPALANRGEDLRALALDQLARAGMQARGEPFGIDPAALRLLLEHDWPGNDLELADVLLRAAATATGPVVTAQDLARIGFRPTLEQAAAASPVPPSARPHSPVSRSH
jgi:DNA-binding NtrC family response regulator